MICSLPYLILLRYHLPHERNIISQHLHIYLLVEPNEPFIEKIHHLSRITIEVDLIVISALGEIHQEQDLYKLMST